MALAREHAAPLSHRCMPVNALLDNILPGHGNEVMAETLKLLVPLD
jgi:hypothetical protein